VAYLYVDYVVRCAMVDWLLCTHTIPQVKQKGSWSCFIEHLKTRSNALIMFYIDPD